MRFSESALDDFLLLILALVVVLCMLVGAHTLIGWPGPVLLLAGGLYYGWRETRNA